MGRESRMHANSKINHRGTQRKSIDDRNLHGTRRISRVVQRHSHRFFSNLEGDLVRKGGLEPPRLAAPDPKSGASANSATFAPISRTHLIIAPGMSTRAKAHFIEAWNAGLKVSRSSTDCAKSAFMRWLVHFTSSSNLTGSSCGAFVVIFGSKRSFSYASCGDTLLVSVSMTVSQSASIPREIAHSIAASIFLPYWSCNCFNS